MKRILNFGSLNTDYVYKVDHILQGGETIQSESRTVFPGGKGLNQSIALVRAGLSVCHAGLIGTDGEHLRDLLNQNGVDTSLIETREKWYNISVNEQTEFLIRFLPYPAHAKRRGRF